jgi:hypothetical protein
MFYSAHGDVVAPRLLYAFMTSENIRGSKAAEPLPHTAACGVEVAGSWVNSELQGTRKEAFAAFAQVRTRHFGGRTEDIHAKRHSW